VTALPLTSSGGQPCHLVKLNPPLNCALRLRARAGLPKLSNTTRRRPDFVLSQTIWRRRRTFLKRTGADAIVSRRRSPSHQPERPVPVPTRGAADPPHRRSGSAHDGGRVPLAAAIGEGLGWIVHFFTPDQYPSGHSAAEVCHIRWRSGVLLTSPRDLRFRGTRLLSGALTQHLDVARDNTPGGSLSSGELLPASERAVVAVTSVSMARLGGSCTSANESSALSLLSVEPAFP
jgi:hypothetical protein